MRAIAGALLFSAAAAWPCIAQTPAQQSTQLHVRSASAREVTFRVETKGSWVQLSRSSAITVRHDGDARIVDITTPAILETGGEGELEITLLTSEPAARLELTAPGRETADGRRIFVYGTRITLRRDVARRNLQLHHDEVVVRGRSD